MHNNLDTNANVLELFSRFHQGIENWGFIQIKNFSTEVCQITSIFILAKKKLAVRCTLRICTFVFIFEVQKVIIKNEEWKMKQELKAFWPSFNFRFWAVLGRNLTDTQFFFPQGIFFGLAVPGNPMLIVQEGRRSLSLKIGVQSCF